jgi:hypothetical protein
MLGTPSIRRYSLAVHAIEVVTARSENAPGADNQQERPLIEQQIVGSKRE